ncbi:hypothetical protein [Spirosoma jeollabukense]
MTFSQEIDQFLFVNDLTKVGHQEGSDAQISDNDDHFSDIIV